MDTNPARILAHHAELIQGAASAGVVHPAVRHEAEVRLLLLVRRAAGLALRPVQAAGLLAV
eukprot:5740269-Pyramimonas_sp.AAC.1